MRIVDVCIDECCKKDVVWCFRVSERLEFRSCDGDGG